jgi:hypothetical protein
MNRWIARVDISAAKNGGFMIAHPLFASKKDLRLAK